MNQHTHSNTSMMAGWISLISNIVLTFLKIIVGAIFNSPVLLADGYHNAGDVIASGATLASMRISKRPADEDHPYGHGKAEVLSSAIVGIILVLAACYIAYESIKVFFEEPEKAGVIAFVTAIISLVWKFILYIYTMNIGKKTNSKGLIATAKDHLADVYASLAAVIGIGLTLVGEATQNNILLFGDPIAGLIVTILVFKLAYGMLVEAGASLMEKSVGQELLDDFHNLILTVPDVKRIDRLRARENGHYILVDLRVSVPANFTIQEGHDIIRKIKKTIMEHHDDVAEVLIHLNPWYEND
ncbi:cation diffusion facilitator family transporter [Lysinibacillus endophyticus]|uniref:Cation transporter n=1 Tax=Ureibacillus endophyticus TaxID=1978490 RepID=A0A494YX87_9BACL|nr:cation diffusion facilitator family transporter [Lysinibacillus endophyticus]MCP1144526.1 cation diffusion facilitator family transporter [Lysinibacillus endophyticus]RKQ14823.1 cation transporter [Lysinibacillus endophyticus]